MKPVDFEKAIADYLKVIQSNLSTKGKEYATDVDMLVNFNKGSNIVHLFL